LGRCQLTNATTTVEYMFLAIAVALREIELLIAR
jgi:hypothetical protein